MRDVDDAYVFAFDVPASGGAPVEFASWWPYDLEHHEALLRELGACGVATVTPAGTTVHGRPLHAVTVAEDSWSHTLAVTSGFHGGEPSGLWAADALLRFAISPAATPLRRWLRIVAVPGVNLDAIAEGLDRRNAGGLNLWLDDAARTAPEVVAVDGVLRDARPDAVLDLHSWHWTSDGCFTPGWLSAGDALYGQVLRLRAAIDAVYPMGGQLFFTDEEACWLVRACVEHDVPAIGVEVSLTRGSDGAFKTVDRARQDGVAILHGAVGYLQEQGR
jgi:predicted deacylase